MVATTLRNHRSDHGGSSGTMKTGLVNGKSIVKDNEVRQTRHKHTTSSTSNASGRVGSSPLSIDTHKTSISSVPQLDKPVPPLPIEAQQQQQQHREQEMGEKLPSSDIIHHSSPISIPSSPPPHDLYDNNQGLKFAVTPLKDPETTTSNVEVVGNEPIDYEKGEIEIATAKNMTLSDNELEYSTSSHHEGVDPDANSGSPSIVYYGEQGNSLLGMPSPYAPPTKWLLEPLRPELQGRKCLVLDLDETLVHSSFKYIHQADFVIPVEIESQYHNVYVIKRPGVDEFMRRVGELYEVVVFTASVSKYGDPLLDQLDVHNVVHHRLFRESCYNHNGNYVKNLSQLGRPLKDTIIIDNSPASYIFHPQHALPISSWFSDIHDNELLDIVPFLEDLAADKISDVSLVLDVNI